jgi:hypothetical protein
VRRFVLVLALAFAALVVPSAAQAAGEIHPGVQTVTDGGQCTANFIFRDANATYIGQAAHCSGTGGATDTNGCDSGSLPTGTPVTVGGATRPGTLVYNSWLTMQSGHEADSETCQFNDLALVRVDPADVGKINPSVPGFGGPVGVASLGGTGSTVFTYGNSELRGGIQKLSPKQGVVVQNTPSGWSHTVYTVTPGIPGDSGSGFMNASGQAIGILSTLDILPTPGGNGVGDLAKELAYMRANSQFSGVGLVPGTQAFKPNLVQAILGA